jgi:hypothetical protein
VAPVLLFTLAISGCASSKKEAPASPPVAATPPPTSCQASSSWITHPTMPPEVASSETFCDFYQFSWQWFLAQVSPVNPSDPNSERVFETNRIHDPSVSSGQCAMKALTGRANALKMLRVRDVKPEDFELKQADGSVLYDQNSNILYFNIWYSEEECQSTASGFAPGTMELKLAWKILPKPDPTYFTIQAALPAGTNVMPIERTVTLGLVGFHLVNWTSNHPEMIWATFEHKSNAPLCNGSSAMPASGWSLTSNAAAQCLTNNPQPSFGPPSASCAQFKFNTAQTVKGTPPPTGKPAQICRQYANGNQPGTSVNGNDNAANLLAIQQLNTALVGPQGLLTQLPDSHPMAVWKNYEMIGGLWTKGGAASGNEPVPNAGGNADPSSPQRGSLELTNMTMETFEQGDTSYVPNCFGCHNYDPTAPLTVSHIATSLFPPSMLGKQAGAAAKPSSPGKAADAAAPAKK